MAGWGVGIFLILSWLHGGLNEDAYRAYKNGDEHKAFDLYEKSYNIDGSIKAAYNLGVFYEKGIGTAVNREKAIEYYKKIYEYLSSQTKFSSICMNPTLPYYKKSLKKLIKFEGRKNYRSLLDKIDRTCNGRNIKNPICTRDGEISEKYRDRAGCIDCDIVLRYPRTVKNYFALLDRLNRVKEEFGRSGSQKLFPKHRRICERIKKTAVPIMREFLKKEIECIKKAKTGMDLTVCSMGYFHCATRIFGYKISVTECPSDSKSPDCIEEARERKRTVTEKEKKEMIESIRRSIKKNDYKEYFEGVDCSIL